MKDRLFKNWTLRRIVFLVIGGFTLYLALKENDWLFGVIGGYFALMGLFSLGCARPRCGITGGPDSFGKIKDEDLEDLTDIDYEEIK